MCFWFKTFEKCLIARKVNYLYISITEDATDSRRFLSKIYRLLQFLSPPHPQCASGAGLNKTYLPDKLLGVLSPPCCSIQATENQRLLKYVNSSDVPSLFSFLYP